MPDWLSAIAAVSLFVAALCAAFIVVDIAAGRRQRMWIMNVVWPVTALYAGPLGLWFYLRAGRSGHAGASPFWLSAAKAATHCGGGCTLGDLLVEGSLALFPALFTVHSLFAVWGLDFVAAFLLGIAFQYFTIAPMRGLTPAQGLIAALKADTLSLSAWQVGMYGWMALVIFGLFGHELARNSATFWFMMQVAMLVGFATAYPVNWWLLRAGVKETM